MASHFDSCHWFGVKAVCEVQLTINDQKSLMLFPRAMGWHTTLELCQCPQEWHLGGQGSRRKKKNSSLGAKRRFHRMSFATGLTATNMVICTLQLAQPRSDHMPGTTLLLYLHKDLSSCAVARVAAPHLAWSR